MQDEQTNTVRNKVVSDWKLKCVSRRLSIGGDCLKTQCLYLSMYVRVVCRYSACVSLVNVTQPGNSKCVYRVELRPTNTCVACIQPYQRYAPQGPCLLQSWPPSSVHYPSAMAYIQTKMATLQMLFTSPHVIEFLFQDAVIHVARLFQYSFSVICRGAAIAQSLYRLRQRAGCRRNRGWIPGRGERFIACPKRPHRLWGQMVCVCVYSFQAAQ